MKKFIAMAAIVMVMVMGTLAQAALFDRGADTLGNHLIYDSDKNITWYDFSQNRDTYANQMSWADNLNVTMASTGHVISDWRLPSTVNGPFNTGIFPGSTVVVPTPGFDGTTTNGYNVSSSEMGHLFYTELGNNGDYDKSGIPQSGSGLVNKGPFANLRTDDSGGVNSYWSETRYDFTLMRQNMSVDHAWQFDFKDGVQSGGYIPLDLHFAIAVRTGDVAPVPLPGTVFLFAPALACLGLLRRKHKQE